MTGHRRSRWRGGLRAAALMAQMATTALLAGNVIAGPALIEEHASTTVVHPGDRLEVDAFGNLVIDIRRSLR